MTEYILLSRESNRTINDHLSDLFINEWSTTVNYSKYFYNCNPSVCTYTTRNLIDYSYTIALFTSLYGGLILILRLISPFLVNTSLSLKYQLRNGYIHEGIYFMSFKKYHYTYILISRIVANLFKKFFSMDTNIESIQGS